MKKYKVLNKNIFSKGIFKIIPIRFEDRFDIMKWRNEQMYHLRQNKPLTLEDQNYYFTNVVAKLFDQEQPNQVLFTYLENDVCIGYGGLVHINWIDRNAEISFVLNTEMEIESFQKHWVNYLVLIEKVAFEELQFHKIFTYAFDLRPQLYKALENSGFIKDARLKDHCLFDNRYLDVVIHSKINHKC
jgi:RimJ/RimL family protein N-acetyltransferase